MKTVESANIQYALAFGTQEEKEVSQQIIQVIGEAVARDLVASGLGDTRIEHTQLPLLVARPLREYIERYMGDYPLNQEAWELLSQFLEEHAGIKLSVNIKDETTFSEIAELYNFDTSSNFHDPLFLDNDILFTQREEVRRHIDSSDEKVLPIILDSGRGSRQGLLGLICGSKGKITLFGHELRSLATRPLAVLIQNLPPSRRWCIVLPGDELFLPSLTDRESLENQLIDGPQMFVFTRSPSELVFFGEDSTATQLIEKLLIKGILSLRNHGLERFVRGTVSSGMSFRRRFAFQENGGDQLPSGRIMTVQMLDLIIKSYNEIAEDGLPLWNRRPAGGEFFWYNRVTTAMRTSLDEWRLLWEPGTGLSFSDWDKVWRKENQFRPYTQGVCYTGTWMNLNTPAAIHAFYRNSANSKAIMLRSRIRALARIPFEGNRIKSVVEGDVVFAGDYLVHRSRIHVLSGVKLIVGNRVVIDRSLIEAGESMRGRIIHIPDDTVIVDSHIKGSPRGDGCNGLIYRVSSDRLTFHAGSFQTTVYLSGGRRELFRHALEYKPGLEPLGNTLPHDLDYEGMDRAKTDLLRTLQTD